MASKLSSEGSRNIFIHGLGEEIGFNGDWRTLLASETSSFQNVDINVLSSSIDASIFVFVSLGTAIAIPKRSPLISFSDSGGLAPSFLENLKCLRFARIVAVGDTTGCWSTLQILSEVAYVAQGSLDIIDTKDDGITAAPHILDEILQNSFPRLHRATLFMGHLSGNIQLEIEPTWRDLALRHNFSAVIPSVFSIVEFRDAAVDPNPTILAQFAISSRGSIEDQGSTFLSMLADALRTKHKIAVLSQTTAAWTGIIVPNMQFLGLLILPARSAPSPTAFPAFAVATLETELMRTDILSHELEQVLEAIRGLPGTAALLFDAAELVRHRARSLSYPGVIDALVSIVEEEKKKLDDSRIHCGYILEELAFCLTVHPEQELKYRVILRVAGAKSAMDKMSVESIVS